MTLSEGFKKIVFLLGAGASKEADCKLSSEMLASLKESINSLSGGDKEFIEYKNSFSEIYHFILASLFYQSALRGTSSNQSININIEDFVMVLRQLIDKEFVVPYPLIGNWNDKILKWELSKEDVFIRFKNFITLLLVKDWTRFDTAKAIKMLQPVRTILDAAEDFKINIFSLNYDLIFEHIFNNERAKLLDNGFSEMEMDGDKIKYWAEDFNDDASPTKMNLFKLHGSIDWEYNLESEQISIKTDINDGEEPLIIFGSSSKMLSFDPFLYMLSSFRKALQDSTIFVVIGYSFHDKYINNLLIQQLSQNTEEGDVSKRLLIVDPFKDSSAVKFTEELKAIQESKSINDVINFRQISPERIKIIPKNASEFYAEYFAESAKVLMTELTETEQGDKVF
jgi:hypothetical protein